MSLEHLSTGSICPPLLPEKVRIYAMRFCPYAQRALLALAAKDINYAKTAGDVVFINLKDKPEWIFSKNPDGKVPTVERSDGKCIYESLIVSDYFDDTLSGTQLHPKDPFQKAVDRILVENFGKLGPLFYRMIFLPETPPGDIPKLFEDYEKIITEFSMELEKRGTNFFGGNDHPGMADYMIWPWFERRPVIQLQHPDLKGQEIIAIDQWVERMKEDPAVQMWYLTPEVHHKYNQTVRTGSPDFNMLFEK
ncbi:glutathione S-transferase omega-1 [Folsomia candida]|uniref:Glutathione S-transferase omega-1 n=1 Tax=Folsomia candida TaxID=158441 RepID=A0A226EHN4_FOLCA|nr:glutathione S-transferase omega-1 [Folsomia candida]OXA56544.1 Glutathione S-transferase omega-1 [Folsomia candida]